MRLYIKTILVAAVVAALFVPSAAPARTPRNRTVHRIIHYDTVRVVVTDTVKVVAKPSPRIDTLRLEQSPAQIDSLVEAWQQMLMTQSEQAYFEPYSEPLAGEEKLPVDSLYSARLQDLMSPLHLPYNAIVRTYIEQYLNGRWSPLSRVLGVSKLYFPIVEQEMVNAGIPIELRALAIVESSLVPTAVSRMGAAGLWQFMPATAKNMGLEVNSLVDERFDIALSTRAACRFLKDLYRIYNDWTLALAAYNCGPGNVNKAIARAGAGSKTFWDIYDFLPRETRGYVPKFIAATYAYAYHGLHDIAPSAIPDCIATDTLQIDRVMHLGQVASTLDIPLETLRSLNPQYKLDIVPATRKSYALRLPVRYASEFIMQRDSIYAKDSMYLKEYMNPANLDRKRAEGVGYIYKVKSGDNLSVIAKRNRVTVKELMRWNGLKSSVIRPGQRLRIERPKPR